MDIHIVYAGRHYLYKHEKRLQSFILKGMTKNKINKVMVTYIHMFRDRLITNERLLEYRYLKKRSVNDDFDLFFEDLRLGKEADNTVDIHFLPELTAEELKLVEQKDEKFMDTFYCTKFRNADVRKAEMAASESKSKFVYAEGRRRTYTINNSSK